MKYNILETLSFKQQVTLFYHSDIIMSPHGTGLINIMFSLPHSTLIECHPPFYYDVWYINTASLTSAHYIGVSTYMPKSKMSKLYKEMSNLYNTGNFLHIIGNADITRLILHCFLYLVQSKMLLNTPAVGALCLKVLINGALSLINIHNIELKCLILVHTDYVEI